MTTYTITLTDRQAATLSEACELLARLGVGQITTLIDYIPSDTWRRSDIVRKVETFAAEITPSLDCEVNEFSSPYRKRQRDTSNIAWDIHQVLRHRRAWDEAIRTGMIKDGEPRTPAMFGVQYNEPHQMGSEPLARIVKEIAK